MFENFAKLIIITYKYKLKISKNFIITYQRNNLLIVEYHKDI